LNYFRLCIGICGIAALLFASSGCTSVGSHVVVWADSSADLVWPPPPEKARIRYLRSIAPAEFAGEESGGKKLWRLFAGDDEKVLPLVAPYGVTADGEGRVWLADAGTHAVHLFDLGRDRIDIVAAVGKEALVSPVGVAFDGVSGRLYVSDSSLRKVFVTDALGKLQGVLELPNGFGRPAGLATDAEGNLYVVDAVRGRVEVFSAAGAHIASLGGAIAPGEQLHGPTNVFVDRQGRIYVADSLNFRVVILGPDGNLVRAIGRLGDVAGSFARPRGVAVDSEGHIYVADAAFDNIQIFDASGNLLLYLGGVGKGAGQFSLPAGLFFDKYDRLYVADSFNHRIQVFEYLSAGSSGKDR